MPFHLYLSIILLCKCVDLLNTDFKISKEELENIEGRQGFLPGPVAIMTHPRNKQEQQDGQNMYNEHV